ncbi:hypothetical protein SAMN05444003_3065 [Cognatiyoonia sediminum]|uniref:Uncharacterized protein n=1 Tax=Cognatiyoonia sediminum TaxID=1508389 RepID=A0A1M5SRQ7_9RHOB|nr:hypothetical protein SAMN05444003_3065 [Cognatiyoonia sediminum]
MDRHRDEEDQPQTRENECCTEKAELMRMWQSSTVADGFSLEWTLDHLERSKELRS